VPKSGGSPGTDRARNPPVLHLTASLRIVAKHKHMPKLTVVQARDAIEHLATAAQLTREEQRLAQDLEAATKIPVAELARITKQWPST